MRKTFRDMMKSVALHCVAAGAVLTVLSMASCKQGHVPNAQLPELRNDTGVNIMLTLDPNGGFWDNDFGIILKKLNRKNYWERKQAIRCRLPRSRNMKQRSLTAGIPSEVHYPNASPRHPQRIKRYGAI